MKNTSEALFILINVIFNIYPYIIIMENCYLLILFNELELTWTNE